MELLVALLAATNPGCLSGTSEAIGTLILAILAFGSGRLTKHSKSAKVARSLVNIFKITQGAVTPNDFYGCDAGIFEQPPLSKRNE
ncbi:hypothetical protein [Candidatus Tisiphia endosymbiont of Xenochironomus xenolabis]|uniref:hypothetical protein n=1 Tax=unclassified Candidatus Tisiphia TaxID=2996318 RepID=UPI0035C908C0